MDMFKHTPETTSEFSTEIEILLQKIRVLFDYSEGIKGKSAKSKIDYRVAKLFFTGDMEKFHRLEILDFLAERYPKCSAVPLEVTENVKITPAKYRELTDQLSHTEVRLLKKNEDSSIKLNISRVEELYKMLMSVDARQGVPKKENWIKPKFASLGGSVEWNAHGNHLNWGDQANPFRGLPHPEPPQGYISENERQRRKDEREWPYD